MSKQSTTPLTYRDAGVDINAGNSLVEMIKPIAKSTHRAGVVGSPGGFGALFELPLDRYQHPLLVSGTDGVGTKLKLALELGQHDGIGIDLVAMCANDIIVLGAEPLFFLDYYATGKLDVDTATTVIRGIGKGCKYAGAALVGGETAEMPGLYEGDDYDLAGFCVGIVEKDRVIDGSAVEVGDNLIGIASSGPHSNGYSLIRRIIDVSETDLAEELNGQSIAEWLMQPTRIYVRSLMNVLSRWPIHALAHITGGGLPENLPRVLPDNTRAVIDANSWERSPIFDWLQKHGQVESSEMLRTFNCGIGMVACVSSADTGHILASLEDSGEKAWVIGTIESAQGAPEVVVNNFGIVD